MTPVRGFSVNVFRHCGGELDSRTEGFDDCRRLLEVVFQVPLEGGGSHNEWDANTLYVSLTLTEKRGETNLSKMRQGDPDTKELKS